jgi:phenylpropionate dioxygenase-like ring-hydroxylating dioxygenase large terminal subunit
MTAVTLANFWHPVTTSDEVTDQPRQFRLLGTELALFRDGEGVAAFKDLCIHRGTMLSLGSAEDGRITCPYHGWQYDRTGACVAIPSLPAGSTIPRKARAITYPVVERYGLVWVALEEPVAPIPRWPDDAYDDPAFRTFLAASPLWRASAGRATENAADLSHFNFVHTGLLALADGPVMKKHEVRERDYLLEYGYDDGTVCREYSLYAPFTVFIKKYGVGSGGSTTEFDKKSTEGGVMIYTQFHCPLDATTTRVFVHIGRNHSLDEDDATFAGDSIWQVLEQDRLIVESQRPEEIPTDLRDELHLKVPDASGIAYRRMLGRIADVTSFLP